jgi:hypothetical protein
VAQTVAGDGAYQDGGDMNALDRRFWSKVNYTSTCWSWLAYKNKDGYGRFIMKGKVKFAHRVAYESMHGNVPAGMELDHLCKNRACVNPSHMEPVTHIENVKRGNANYKKHFTHCVNGHPLNQKRKCNICQAAAQRRYRERKLYAAT